EARVLEAARESARRHGLDPDGVSALFDALIAAARTIQRGFLARPWPVEPLDLEREARPALARISEAAIARAASLACDVPKLATEPQALAEALDPQTPLRDRWTIADRLLSLRALSPCETARGLDGQWASLFAMQVPPASTMHAEARIDFLLP